MNDLLYVEEGLVLFTGKITSLTDTAISITLYQTLAWDECGAVAEQREYAQVWIQGDGCSELSMHGTHLCGEYSWKQHCKVLEWLYKTAFVLIPGHRKEQEWTE